MKAVHESGGSIIYVDTDSCIFRVKKKQLSEKILALVDDKKIGFFKNEYPGKIIKKIVAPAPKAYCIVAVDEKNINRMQLTVENMEALVKEGKIIECINCSIQRGKNLENISIITKKMICDGYNKRAISDYTQYKTLPYTQYKLLSVTPLLSPTSNNDNIQPYIDLDAPDSDRVMKNNSKMNHYHHPIIFGIHLIVFQHHQI